MPNMILCRGGKIVERRVFASEMSPPPFWFKDHFEPIIDPNRSDLSRPMSAFRERFELNDKFHCPVCDSYFYNSVNWLEAPEWAKLT